MSRPLLWQKLEKHSNDRTFLRPEALFWVKKTLAIIDLIAFRVLQYPEAILIYLTIVELKITANNCF